MTALSTRKKSILSNIEWKTIPWTQHKKTAKDKLVDILLDIPALLENFDIMQSVIDPAEKQIMHHGLVIHAWSLDAQLTEWHNKFPIDFPHSTPSNSNSIDLADLAAAHVATLYWSICIRLHTIFHDLVFLTHSTGTDLPERMDLKYYCHRIVTTLPIFFHPAVGTYRQHLAPFPIACVWRVIFRLGADEMAAEKKLLMSCLDLPESETIKKFLESLDVILPS